MKIAELLLDQEFFLSCCPYWLFPPNRRQHVFSVIFVYHDIHTEVFGVVNRFLAFCLPVLCLRVVPLV